VIAGLRRFLASYVVPRSSSPNAVAYAGMMNFLDKHVLLLHGPQAAVTVVAATPEPSPLRLAATFASLHQALQNARANGDFLQVWSVAGLKRNEFRNAAVLSWLIDPNGSHGQGSAILRGLLSAAAETTPSWPLHDVDLSRITVRTEERPLASDRDRVDIAIDGPDFLLFVEVKIDAAEGTLQLLRYAEAAKDKACAWRKKNAVVIYLSRRPPTDPPPDVAILTWRRIVRVLSDVPGQRDRRRARAPVRATHPFIFLRSASCHALFRNSTNLLLNTFMTSTQP